MRLIPVNYTCEIRSEYIGDDAACVAAFLHCCKAMENERAERQEDNLQLARSKIQCHRLPESGRCLYLEKKALVMLF